jgi:16S rRNA (uracil1498-N3)-methyltransferase
MSLPRFYCPGLRAGQITISDEESRHATTVLRLGSGDPVELFDGQGQMAAGVIATVTRGGLMVRVDSEPQAVAPLRPALTIITAVPRATRQPFLIEKCTELGVATVLPTRFERSTVRPAAKSSQRWRRAAVEAGKQCGSLWLPQIAEPAELRATLLGRTEPVLLYGSLEPVAMALADVLSEGEATGDAAVWIGPEGGMTDDELAGLHGIAARPVRLGPNVLRLETAAIVVAAAFALWRDRIAP